MGPQGGPEEALRAPGGGGVSNPSLSAQNLLGLRDAPRQFFLQVYHVLGSLGDTRYLLALFPRPGSKQAPPSEPRPSLLLRGPGGSTAGSRLGSQVLWAARTG